MQVECLAQHLVPYKLKKYSLSPSSSTLNKEPTVKGLVRT